MLTNYSDHEIRLMKVCALLFLRTDRENISALANSIPVTDSDEVKALMAKLEGESEEDLELYLGFVNGDYREEEVIYDFDGVPIEVDDVALVMVDITERDLFEWESDKVVFPAMTTHVRVTQVGYSDDPLKVGIWINADWGMRILGASLRTAYAVEKDEDDA